jgi:hypothetical protein
MTYQLKSGVESFEVVDGPMAGRKFVRGKVYSEIPPGEEKKFKPVEPVKPVKPVKPEEKPADGSTGKTGQRANGPTATERSKP